MTIQTLPDHLDGYLPLDHLAALSDSRGLFEHAEHTVRRREHGYCLDDVARGLTVAVRAERDSPLAAGLIEVYLRFTERAVTADGQAHNRMDQRGAWSDRPDVGDWWGRALRALAFAATRSVDPDVRRRARLTFERAARQRSPHVRAMVFAAIGAAEILAVDPRSETARRLLVEAAATFPRTEPDGWLWPEPRLRYDNAAIAEAMLAAGDVLDDPDLTERGLSALTFLVFLETRNGHLSVTGVDGRGRHEHLPQFDQQPIEVAAIAEASGRAHRLGHGEHWAATVRLAWGWFLGDNDAGIRMIDAETGAGFDGLQLSGRNLNRGAESTLAALSTGHQVRLLSVGAPR